jgi:hypothetical protein
MMNSDRMGKVPIWAAHAVVAAGLFAGAGCGSGGTTGSGDAAVSEEDAGTAEGGDSGRTACETMECFRPYVCVLMLCGPPQQVGCCPCQPPYFDDIQCVRDGAAYESGLP